MTPGNKIINKLNTKKTRGFLRALIFFKYKLKGDDIKYVRYHEGFRAWEFRIGEISYLSSGPGWAYNQSYLVNQVKKLSGYDYLPHSGDIVIDIGAGVGEEVIVYSSLVGQKGSVFAIEAHPKTFEAVCYLIEVNKLKNVVPVNIAFADKSGVVSIEDRDDSLGNSIGENMKGNSFDVRAETFDDFVEKNKLLNIDFVKMNVEGAEQLIIRGMERNISKIRHLAISCHDFRYRSGESEFFKTKDKVTEFLLRNNFQLTFQKSEEGMVEDFVYATNTMQR